MFGSAYLYCALGVAISILLPVLLELLTVVRALSGFSLASSISATIRTILFVLITGVLSLLVAILLVAILKDNLQDWRTAILFGYAWDSTLQKLTAKYERSHAGKSTQESQAPS